MTQQVKYGQRVKVLQCPLNGQHINHCGRVLESNGHVLCVELDDGQRCWTSIVEPAADGQE